MPFPYIQLLVGIGVGIIGFFLIRQQPIRNEPHRDTRRQRKPSAISKPEDKCCICLQGLHEMPMTYLRCTHALHDQCLRGLREVADSCPLCREKL